MPMYRASAPFFMGVRGDRRVTGDLPYPLLQEGDGDGASLSALSVLPLQGESERVFPRSRILERIWPSEASEYAQGGSLRLNSLENLWVIAPIGIATCGMSIPWGSLSPFCHPCHPLKRVQTLCGRRFCHPVTLLTKNSCTHIQKWSITHDRLTLCDALLSCVMTAECHGKIRVRQF